MRRSAASCAEHTTRWRGQFLPGGEQAHSGAEESGQRRDEPIYIGGRVVRLNRDAHKTLVLPVNHGYLNLVLVPEPPLELLPGNVRLRNGDRAHLAVPVGCLRADGWQAGERADTLAGGGGKFVACRADGGPVVLPLEIEGGGHAQIGGGIASAGPAEVVLKRR